MKRGIACFLLAFLIAAPAFGQFKRYEPDKPKPPGKGPVTGMEIALLTPQDEIARVTSVAVLAGYIKGLEAALHKGFVGYPKGPGKDLIVQIEIGSKGAAKIDLNHRPEIDRKVLMTVYRRLAAVRPPTVGGSVRFALLVRIWGGTGQKMGPE